MKTRFNIAVYLGTRPELIKLAPVVQALSRVSEFSTHLVLSNQHQELLKGLNELFDMPAHRQLRFNNQAPNLSQMTSQLIHLLDEDLLQMKGCDAIIVQGDTTTALTAAQVGFYHGIPVAHVEAGLRTFDLTQPFPEEFNRQVISKIAAWHFCPTPAAQKNLLNESVSPDRIHVVGNTVIDALEYVRTRKIPPGYENSVLDTESPELGQALKKIRGSGAHTLALLTLHRRESQGSDQEKIFAAIREFAHEHPSHHFIYPYHLNPKVRLPAFKFLSDIANVHLIPPIGYRAMMYLLGQIDFAVSDSGGIQEETPSFAKPLLILRNQTERPEVVTAGFAKLVGHDPEKLKTMMEELLNAIKMKSYPEWFQAKAKNPFGDGRAAERIAQILLQSLKGSATREKAA